MSTEQHIESTGPVEMSASIAKLAPALVEAQKTIGHATKDSENPHFGSKYADLAATFDACRAALAAHGFAITQPVASEGRRVRVCTMLLHASGEWIRSTLTLTAQQDSPQAIGSAITYGRRYGLQALAGVAAEDDDGNAASAAPARPQGRQERPARPSRQDGPGGGDWIRRIAAADSIDALEAVRGDLYIASRKGGAPDEDSDAGRAIVAAMKKRRAELMASA